MKIRTITTGVTLQSPGDYDGIRQAAEFNLKAKEAFENAGLEVQTTRIATNSWEEYTKGIPENEIVSAVRNIEKLCKNLGVDFFSIGYAATPDRINLIPEIIKSTSIISCSAKIADSDTGIDLRNVRSAALAVKRIAKETEKGYGNFRFCAAANCGPGIPFFPAAFHEGSTAFGLGLECGDLVMKAFSKSADLQDAEKNLEDIFTKETKRISDIAYLISMDTRVKYNGIDVSANPGLQDNESLAYAFEKLSKDRFGSQGTLAIAAMITRVLKALPVIQCGYSGLMLPVTEDRGLAARAGEETFSITGLLLYSAVCGCGLDTVPVPGDTPAEKIEAILLDVASLAVKLNKPLSARLFPVPRKKAGDMTDFNSPYLTDCRILRID